METYFTIRIWVEYLIPVAVFILAVIFIFGDELIKKIKKRKGKKE